MALTDPVPSQAIDVFKRNVEDSDRFVNQTNGTVTNRTGKTMRPLPVISDAIEQQITNLTADINAAKADLYPIVKFRFLVDTYEITNRNELGDTATGETYRYIGATLPFNVTPATNPVGNPDFAQVIQTDHNNLTNRNDVGAHDDIYCRTFDSVADAINYTGHAVGLKYIVSDYYGGGAPNNSGVMFFKVVPANTGLVDGGKYIDVNGGELQLEQNLKVPYSAKCFGAKCDGVNSDSVPVQSVITYAQGKRFWTGGGGSIRITSPIMFYSGSKYINSGSDLFIQDYAAATESGRDSMFFNEHWGDNNNINTDIAFIGFNATTGPAATRSTLLALNRVKGVYISKLKIDKKTGSFCVWISGQDITIDGVEIFSQYEGITNADGIHFEYVEDLNISNVNIKSEDDCLAFTYFPLDGIYNNPAGRDRPSRNINVNNVLLSSTSNGVRLGNTTLLGLAKDNLYHPDARYVGCKFNNLIFDKVGPDGYCIALDETRQNSAAPNDDITFSNITLRDDTSANQMIRVRGNPYTNGSATYAGNENTRNFGTIRINNATFENSSQAPSIDVAGVKEFRLHELNLTSTDGVDNEFITSLVDEIYISNSKIKGAAKDSLSNTLFIRDFKKLNISNTDVLGSGLAVAGVRIQQPNFGDVGELKILGGSISGHVGGVHAVSPVTLDLIEMSTQFNVSGSERNSNLKAVDNDVFELININPSATKFTNNECRKVGSIVSVNFDINVSSQINSGDVIADFPTSSQPSNLNPCRSIAVNTAFDVYPFEFSKSGGLIARRNIPPGIYFYNFSYTV